MSVETDRELLEMAAKAAGISIDKSEANGGGVEPLRKRLHQIAEPGCTRSHPHEAMSPECRIRAVIAEMRNREARGAEATEHCLGRFADVLERALSDRAMRAQAAPVAQGDAEDAARLDWLLLRISGAEFRRIGVCYSGNARRADVDAARAHAKEGGA